MSIQQITEKLKTYKFTDELGHPLENYVDYQQLIAEVESLQKEIEIKTQYLNQKDDEIRKLRAVLQCVDVIDLRLILTALESSDIQDQFPDDCDIAHAQIKDLQQAIAKVKNEK